MEYKIQQYGESDDCFRVLSLEEGHWVVVLDIFTEYDKIFRSKADAKTWIAKTIKQVSNANIGWRDCE